MSTGQLLGKTGKGLYGEAQGPGPGAPKNLLSHPSLFLSVLLWAADETRGFLERKPRLGMEYDRKVEPRRSEHQRMRYPQGEVAPQTGILYSLDPPEFTATQKLKGTIARSVPNHFPSASISQALSQG